MCSCVTSKSASCARKRSRRASSLKTISVSLTVLRGKLPVINPFLQWLWQRLYVRLSLKERKTKRKCDRWFRNMVKELHFGPVPGLARLQQQAAYEQGFHSVGSVGRSAVAPRVPVRLILQHMNWLEVTASNWLKLETKQEVQYWK